MVTFAAELRWILMLVCLAIFCLVFVVMVVVAWRQYRKGDPLSLIHISEPTRPY